MKHRTVGLDIGSQALRGAEVHEDRRGTVLHRYAERQLPRGLVDHGQVTDASSLRAELRSFWKQSGFRTKRVALAIGGPTIVVRTAEIREADASDDDALLDLLTDVVPMPLGEAIVDTMPVDEFLDTDGSPKLRILVVAAPRVLVETAVEAVLGARLTPVRVDLAPIAAARAVATRHASLDGKTSEIVVDLGASMTSVVVTADGLPRMVRILPGGAAQAVAEMELELGCSREEALRQGSLVGMSAAAPMQPLPGTSGILERTLGPTISEIARSIEYYRGTADAAMPTRAVLVGGGSRVGGLVQRLESELGVPVVVGNAFSNLSKVNADPRADVFGAVAVGAGLDR